MVQADHFAELASVTVLPITSTLIAAPLFRVPLQPSPENGLRLPSQVMVDKAQTAPRRKLGPVMGRLDDAAMLTVDRAMAVFLGLA